MRVIGGRATGRFLGVLLKACLNGARPLHEHPALSADAELLALQASGAVQAGADAIHLHPKDAHGSDSLTGADVARFVQAARQACPGVPIGITTGAWATPDPGRRLDAITSWTTLPDFASVNWHEDGADEVAELLLSRGIGVEAGIWNDDGLRRWQQSHARTRCLRALVELPNLDPDEDLVQMVARLAEPLIAGIKAGAPTLPVLLHGEERTTWATVDLARRLGMDARIGLEDTLQLPDGSVAEDNAQLVGVALSRMAV